MNESKLVASIVNSSSENRFFPTCRHCDEVGHIQPKYWKLHSGNNDTLNGQVVQLVVKVNRITQLVQSSTSYYVKPSSKRIKKVSDKRLVILNALLVTKLNVWHRGSEGSRYMTRDKDVILSLAPFNGGDFVFDCGDKSQITENYVIDIPYLP